MNILNSNVYIFKMSHQNSRPAANDRNQIVNMHKGEGKRSAKRAQQISNLHQQFEDLKGKIREVEDKNEKIIDKIHKAYNFKKKSGFVGEYLGQTEPIIHYENKFYV